MKGNCRPTPPPFGRLDQLGSLDEHVSSCTGWHVNYTMVQSPFMWPLSMGELLPLWVFYYLFYLFTFGSFDPYKEGEDLYLSEKKGVMYLLGNIYLIKDAVLFQLP